jgi:hypothetical protein
MQDIGSVILLPAPDILISGAYLNRSREVQTTVAALFAGEFQVIYSSILSGVQ